MSDELTIHIYPGDCDTAGHVNHAVMLTLLERARWAALEKHMPFEDYIRRSQWAVVRHVDVSYSSPAVPGDDFIVTTGLASIGNTSCIHQNMDRSKMLISSSRNTAAISRVRQVRLHKMNLAGT